jgi:type IV pilus assembly protein PilQ
MAVLTLLLFLGTVNNATATETKNPNSLISINKISTKVENGQTTAFIQANGQLVYKSFALHNPERLVVDIKGVRNTFSSNAIAVTSNLVDRVRIGEQQDGDVRIVFDLKEACAYNFQPTGEGLLVHFAVNKTAIKSAVAKDAPANKASDTAKADKAVGKKAPKTNDTPPAAPPDTTGLVSNVNSTPIASEKGRERTAVAKDTKDAKEATSAEERPTAAVPAVKGPNPRSMRAAARAASAKTPTATTTTAVDDTTPQFDAPSGNLRFGDLGYVGEPIVIDITEVEINELLRFISDSYGENFILDKSVDRVSITLKVNGVPWNQVLESIFRANQLSFIREGMIVRIATLEALAAEQDKQRQIEEAKLNNIPKVSKFFRLKYTRLAGGGAAGTGSVANLGGASAGGFGATGIIGIIRKTLSKVGEVDADPRTNQLIITDIPQKIEAVEELIAKLDVPEPQVEIEARVVLANRTFMRAVGNQIFAAATQSRGPEGRLGPSALINTSPGASVDLQRPIRTDNSVMNNNVPRPGSATSLNTFLPVMASGLNGAGNTVLGLTTGVLGTSLLSTAISLSEQKGIAKTISAPRVTVQNNTSADITSGTQIAVQTEVNNTVTTNFVTAALRLNVTPQIADEGNVLLRIVVENNSVDRSLRTNGGTPSINTQRAETLVLVPDGGTTILGGINLDTESNVTVRTPGLARVPFLGELFKRRSVDRNSQELLFFVTPRIYRPETVGAISAPPSPSPTANTTTAPVSATTGGER